MNQDVLISTDHKRGFELETPLPKTDDIDRFAKLFPTPKSISLLDVFNSVNRVTNFLDTFEPFDFYPNTKKPDLIYIYAGLLKHTTRKSLAKIAKQVGDIDQSRLEDVLRLYFSLENLKRANDKITGFIDGMKIASIPETGLHPYYFDIRENLLTKPTVLCCTEVEFPYALDRLLGNSTTPIEQDDIIIKDQMVCREVLFGIADLLGFSYATRIKDFSEYKIYRNEECDTKNIKADAVIDYGVIEKNWDEMLRFVATIKTAYTPAAVLIPKFINRFDDPIHKGLRELGRVIQTIFILKYIDSLELRQTIERHLEKITFHAKLSKFVQKPRGESEFISYQNREIADACASLFKNCIMAWNWVYLSKIKGTVDIEKILKHGFRPVWEHIRIDN